MLVRSRVVRTQERSAVMILAFAVAIVASPLIGFVIHSSLHSTVR